MHDFLVKFVDSGGDVKELKYSFPYKRHSERTILSYLPNTRSLRVKAKDEPRTFHADRDFLAKDFDIGLSLSDEGVVNKKPFKKPARAVVLTLTAPNWSRP